ncbi:hypothetical protein FP435_00385 (plasmid) [Lactobacillus sp. PV037]|uniref:hypothetical protein n=1 Tax=Lactobacillus sp. PV037 TaxID=2594496 RepID=UPI00223F2A8C|nr:hypothetical protein [Lactobacillus sp. PV037]QNQ82994.1 hypothetical protein FP435_00385 [Lactobacillus sp. PV037]
MSKNPTLTISPSKIYVLQTNQKDPYNLKDLLSLKAIDYRGRDISSNIVLSQDDIDYSKSGNYSVTVAVLDDQSNMTLSAFTVCVLTSQQADELENAQEDKNNSSNRTNNSGKDNAKSTSISSKLLKGYSHDKLKTTDSNLSLFDKFVTSIVNNSSIWILCSAIVIFFILFFGEMFFI